jgi:hypothetical protein
VLRALCVVVQSHVENQNAARDEDFRALLNIATSERFCSDIRVQALSALSFFVKGNEKNQDEVGGEGVRALLNIATSEDVDRDVLKAVLIAFPLAVEGHKENQSVAASLSGVDRLIIIAKSNDSPLQVLCCIGGMLFNHFQNQLLLTDQQFHLVYDILHSMHEEESAHHVLQCMCSGNFPNQKRLHSMLQSKTSDFVDTSVLPGTKYINQVVPYTHTAPSPCISFNTRVCCAVDGYDRKRKSICL